MRTADALSPEIAAALAVPLFRYAGPPRRVHAREHAIHDQAKRSQLRVGRDRIAVYEWGDGDRIALLVHGWRGRAAQFAAIVSVLRDAGFRIVAFDAPGNGDSSGSRTDVARTRNVMHALQQRHGAADLVVAHSFGMLAVIAAAQDGFAIGQVVAIASVGRFRTTLHGFAEQVGLSPAAVVALDGRLRRMRLPGVADTGAFIDGMDAGRHPLTAGVPLTILHDREDAVVSFGEAEALHAAHPGSILIPTSGLGHTRILAAEATLDAVLAAAINAATRPESGALPVPPTREDHAGPSGQVSGQGEAP